MRRRTRTGEPERSGVQIQNPGSGIVVCIDSYHGRRIRFRKAAADNVRIGGIGSACFPQRLPPIDKRDRPDYLAWDLSSHLSSAFHLIISNSGLQIKQNPFKPRSHQIRIFTAENAENADWDSQRRATKKNQILNTNDQRLI